MPLRMFLTMTPTLFGRWQTRLLLLATVGVLVTLPFALGLVGPGSNSVYFWVLAYIAIFGLGWDVLYSYIQKFRWDRDWPGAFQLLAGVWEAVFVACGAKLGLLPLPVPKEQLPLGWFLAHYSVVWLAVYLTSQTLMRILFLRWRFHGGQWLN